MRRGDSVTGSTGRRRLGRGLEALLGPSTVAEARAEGTLTQIPVSALRPNPYQPRQVVDEAAVAELAESMRSAGLLQPVVARPADNGAFELIAGERRWRAAQRLGWTDIGAVVRDADDQTLLTLALVENLQRDALSPIDEARGYRRLIDDFGVSQAGVGELVSRERSTVTNALRLLKLPQAVQDLVHAGKLGTGHARALLAFENPDDVERLARVAVDRELSVREVEALARRGRAPARRPRGGRRADPEVRRVEEALRRRLQTDVRVSTRGKASGRLTINFYSHDDLARILEIVLGEPFDG
ncbi:MAG: ParB/RepB/Spo0J family partition protein [Gemmatimonadales bacterium]|nr:ParB/RepB/Spo0J family partition protein [Gemmatimonadales bacterium]NIN10407.1 ParB/RepB/Spo0J family partition protein [Gemmatimonadales bacterium]NIN49199.1 ParB/RepB/Spo0J family partition protein [Gemmatimonadales bacterium]NIP06663.1 ParB/RepB/Spo0J family partition protein [Gemmatimonadales bacterium]NIQ99993.1 ParB/RepB/Spo0J family partition protein [Gemmatimonadales bacterium]